jgi:hypothetical protein
MIQPTTGMPAQLIELFNEILTKQIEEKEDD